MKLYKISTPKRSWDLTDTQSDEISNLIQIIDHGYQLGQFETIEDHEAHLEDLLELGEGQLEAEDFEIEALDQDDMDADESQGGLEDQLSVSYYEYIHNKSPFDAGDDFEKKRLLVKIIWDSFLKAGARNFPFKNFDELTETDYDYFINIAKDVYENKLQRNLRKLAKRNKIAVDESIDFQSLPITKVMMQDAFQRIYNVYKENFQENGMMSWIQWVNENNVHNLSATLDSDTVLYDKYWRHLPEGVMVWDLVEAYKENKLRTTPLPLYKYPRRTDFAPTNPQQKSPWQWETKDMSPEDIKNVYLIATQRITTQNREEIIKARKALFFAYHTDLSLAEKIGVSEAELNKKMRNLTGTNKKSRDLQNELNQGISGQYQWSGIYNVSYLSEMEVEPEDLDKFVKEIDAGSYSGAYLNKGELLRKNILSTFLAIDSLIQYDDLTFVIGDPNIFGENKNTAGRYFNKEKKIVLKETFPHTISHEIGHYLDYKWGEEFGFNMGLSEATMMNTDSLINKFKFPEEKVQWAHKFMTFVQEISNRSDISSEYRQAFKEVFARFVAAFVEWTHKSSGQYYSGHLFEYQDNFTQEDFRRFVYLLQEKAYLDAKYPVVKKSSFNSKYKIVKKGNLIKSSTIYDDTIQRLKDEGYTPSHPEWAEMLNAYYYFAIGQEEETTGDSYCWIWRGQGILSKKGPTTHGMAFGRDVHGLWRGWYDPIQKLLSIVVPRRFSHNQISIDDIPEKLLYDLGNEFGKDYEIKMF